MHRTHPTPAGSHPRSEEPAASAILSPQRSLIF